MLLGEGIFSPHGESTICKLDALVRPELLKGATVFSAQSVTIIAGSTSLAAEQGMAFNLKDALLVGKIFHKRTHTAVTKQDLEQATPITSHEFVNRFWGSYLYFRVDNQGAVILRDPVGQMPLFYTRLETGKCIFSSEIEILLEIVQNQPGFDWAYLSAFVLRTFITSERTPFAGIYELPHGCQLEYRFVDGATQCSKISPES